MLLKISGIVGRLDLAGARLGGLSPLKVLERGYAVVLDAGGTAVTDAASAEPTLPDTPLIAMVRPRLATGAAATSIGTPIG